MPKAKQDPLSEFGRFLMTKLRDRGIGDLDFLLKAKWKAPSLKKIQRELQSLSAPQRKLVRRAFVKSFDAAIHDFLFALQEQTDLAGGIAVTVAGQNVATLSDGLQGELFTEDGWRARYSAYGEPPDEA